MRRGWQQDERSRDVAAEQKVIHNEKTQRDCKESVDMIRWIKINRAW